MPNCELCGEPMPPGEEMFKYHGYSGDCPKPPITVEAPVQGDLQKQLDRALTRSNELYRMIKFLREHDGECIGDHPDWLAGMDQLLDGEHFDALSSLKP